MLYSAPVCTGLLFQCNCGWVCACYRAAPPMQLWMSLCLLQGCSSNATADEFPPAFWHWLPPFTLSAWSQARPELVPLQGCLLFVSSIHSWFLLLQWSFMSPCCSITDAAASGLNETSAALPVANSSQLTSGSMSRPSCMNTPQHTVTATPGQSPQMSRVAEKCVPFFLHAHDATNVLRAHTHKLFFPCFKDIISSHQTYSST